MTTEKLSYSVVKTLTPARPQLHVIIVGDISRREMNVFHVERTYMYHNSIEITDMTNNKCNHWCVAEIIYIVCNNRMQLTQSVDLSNCYNRGDESVFHPR